jgi:hypothetical protein
MLSEIQGIGGQPGRGDPNLPPALSGSNGNDGTVTAFTLSFADGSDETSIGYVLAQSDQCQMLLNQADGFFFTNKSDDLLKAAILYQRIANRTAFVDIPPAAAPPTGGSALGSESVPTGTSARTGRSALTNASASGGGSTGDDSPMLQAYARDEAIGLTVNPIPQLQSIRQLANTRLNQILSGRDLFGHDPQWGPRLSFFFYQQQYTNLAPQLQVVEENYSQYLAALAAGDAASYLSGAVADAQNRMDEASQQIDMITDPNGPLNTSGFQVGSFSPLLRQKRNDIQAQVQRIEWDISNSYDLSPSLFIDALSSIAMAPTEFNAGVQVLGTGYKTLTEVDSINGQSVNKSYVVNQIEQCGNTIQSLAEGYSVLSNGELQVDDPGAGKLLAAEDSLMSLVNQFKNAIPSSDADKLKNDLDDYVSLVKQRNTAVMTYNACIHLWAQAQADLTYYTTQHQTMGAKLAKIDPSMPAIVFWMKKTMNDLKLQCLRLLNYSAHALRFWGTTDVPITFDLNNGIPDSATLASLSNQLSNKFEDCLTELAPGFCLEFPAPNDAVKLGKFYQLTAGELKSLKKGFPDPDNKNELMYSVVLRNIVAANRGDTSEFAGCANVRATQVRVWLPGAKVDPRLTGLPPLLTVDMTQYGNETVVPSAWSPTPVDVLWNHSEVGISFVYDIQEVDSLADVTNAQDMNAQDLTKGCYNGGAADASVFAPIGPFADWKIIVRETENPNLDLSGVQNAYVEFWITYVKFQDPPPLHT